MNYLDVVALAELRALVLGPRHDFFVTFYSDQCVCKAQRGQQLLHGRAWPDLPFFAVDHELHRP